MSIVSGVYTAGAGLTLTGAQFSIANGAILAAMIASGAISDTHVNAAAAIAKSKLAALNIGDSDIAAAGLTNAAIAAAAAIAKSKLAALNIGDSDIAAAGLTNAAIAAAAAIAVTKIARYPALKNGTTGTVASAGETVFTADSGYNIVSFFMHMDGFGGAQTQAYKLTYSDATTFTSTATASANQIWAIWPNALIDNNVLTDDVMNALPTFTGKTITAIGVVLSISRNHNTNWWAIEA